MTSAELPDPFPLLSADVAAERRELLRRAFPEAIGESGQVDWERLRRALGEAVDAGKERYGLNWPGKAACFTNIQTPSRAAAGPFAREFEAVYRKLAEAERFRDVAWTGPLAALHDGYFAKDKRGVVKDTNGATLADDDV